MHYCHRNFKTKKSLKDAVAARLAFVNGQTKEAAPAITVFNPEADLGQEAPTPENGKVAVGGPHFPAPHTWYASVTIKNGEVVKVS